jgi:predicted acetyltransferase
MQTKTQTEAREEFAKLYESMREENARDGGLVRKSELWEQFIENGIEEERFPPDALTWKMPRSTR